MTRRSLLVLAFASLACAAPALRAQLAFPLTEVAADLAPGTVRHEFTFAFTNAGTAAVKILNVHSSCGCTVPKLVKTDYAPGESGEIVATFDPGQRQGEVRNTLFVQTDSGETVLTTLARIPARVQIIPRLLMFSPAPDRRVLTSTITYSLGLPVTIKEVRSTSAAWTVTAEETAPGSAWQLRIEYDPAAEPAARSGQIEIISVSTDQTEHNDRLYVRANPSAPGGEGGF
jgi:Protein of unknown function (DUF1573)